MTTKDALGDRMKSYEAVETHRRFDSTLPVYARIDGRGFSKFTKDMNRPYDLRMTNTMIGVTKYLVDKTHAACGYVQSDEISLVWDGSETNSKHFFDGKIQKACSVLASMAAAKFATEYFMNFNMWSFDHPHFDCRVIQMPSRTEAVNMLLWRSLDAQKNSVSMLARHHFSHKALQGKSCVEMLVMLEDINVHMKDQPTAFSKGTWLQRVVENRELTDAELEVIPIKHRPAPGTIIQRSSIQNIDMPNFVEVTNRDEVIFDQAVPVTYRLT